MSKPSQHMNKTHKLAKQLASKDIYDWVMESGYFPESYVLPPCFSVEKFPAFGKAYSKRVNNKFQVKSSSLVQIEFPKSNFSDRTFSIIDPENHCDIAHQMSKNWKSLLKVFFNSKNRVCSYSFPIPLDADHPGTIGALRSGRMIYEFIEMAENDIAAEAYQYKFLIKTDIKNCYPSIYTHSLAWAINGMSLHSSHRKRNDPKYLGNKIDKLFHYSNEEQTNGIPIGPVVSDIASELLLSKVDTTLSKSLPLDCLAVRFKDDYRILCKKEEQVQPIIKSLQNALRTYNLNLNEDKTNIYKLPDGIFRPWVSRYHAANPTPKQQYSYKELKELYLSVITIERELPGTGIIDRFLADIVTKDYKPNFSVSKKTLPQTLSILLMLPGFRIKSFPKTLGVIESIIRSSDSPWYAEQIGKHLADYLETLAKAEKENRYLIIWTLYFLKSNNLDRFIHQKYKFKDPLVKSVQSNRSNIFNKCKDFKLFIGIKKSTRQKSLLEHLDVFTPQ